MKYKVDDEVRIKKYVELPEKASAYIINQLGTVGTIINIHKHGNKTLLRIKPVGKTLIGKFWWNAENVEVMK